MLILTAIRMIRRQWRNNELKVMVASLIIAIACLMSIRLITHSIANAMGVQSSAMMGGNLIVTSPTKLPDAWIQVAAQQNLKSAFSVNFLSVLSVSDKLQLAAIKAVDTHYPLLGKLQISEDPHQQATSTPLTPSPGDIWLSSRLFAGLDIKLHQAIQLGETTFFASHVLINDPVSAGGIFNLTPKALININDIGKTGMEQPGSRIEYRWYLSGTPVGISLFESFLKKNLNDTQNLINPLKSRDSLQTAFDRVDIILKLSSLAALLLTGLAITMAVRSFLQREQNSMALLRCFGMSSLQVLFVYTFMLLIICTISILIGILLGYVIQTVVWAYYSAYVSAPPLRDIIHATLQSFSIGLLLMTCVAFPWLWQIRFVEPKQLLLREEIDFEKNTWVPWCIAFILAIIACYWIVPDWELLIFILGSITAGIAVLLNLTAFCWYLIAASRRQVGVGYRYGLLNILRHRWQAFAQIVAFTLTFTILLVMTLLSQSLLSDWKTRLRPDTPNYFAYNLRQDEVSPLKKILSAFGVQDPIAYPMISGRLFAINDIPVLRAVPVASKNANALHRALNLTWTEQVPSDNRIVEGTWWGTTYSGEPLISVEQGLANTLALKLGDKLSFRIGSNTVSGVVSNFRTVNWTSFHPNFYMIFIPGALNNFSATFVTSFYLSKDQQDRLIELVNQFPNLTLLDVGDLLNQIQTILIQLSYLILYLTGFILLSGIVLLYASLTLTLSLRKSETKVLMLLGAGPRIINQGVIAEFGGIGLIAAVISVLLSQGIYYVLTTSLFLIEYHWLWIPNLTMLFLGSLGIPLLALFGLRQLKTLHI